MKTLLLLLGVVVAVLVAGAAAFYLWASHEADRQLTSVVDTHVVTFPMPFPASAEDLAAAGVTADPDGRVALDRARERGRHLVSARYACADCHGTNYGGGVMLDAFPMGRLLGPNLTTGRGSVVAGFTAADWDRAVRHGVRHDGRSSAMPAQDFQQMSDQELSDIVAYIQSLPPVDNEVPPSSYGPLGRVLLATHQLTPAADMIADHHHAHLVEPPPVSDPAFGAHLAATCMGCHGAELAGGPIQGGDPSWPPAANLTPYADGLAGWTYEQFASTLRTGTRPDGTALRAPMTLVMPYSTAMTDDEMHALWAYVASRPAVATP